MDPLLTNQQNHQERSQNNHEQLPNKGRFGVSIYEGVFFRQKQVAVAPRDHPRFNLNVQNSCGPSQGTHYYVQPAPT
jgi:hypothetical protein